LEHLQLIIARKDIGMSPGKLVAQCCHASVGAVINGETLALKDVRPWLEGSYGKIICEAKSKAHLMKAVELARAAGLKEGDWFFVNDECRTELTPENEDGTVTTCVGFVPLPRDVCGSISKKYQLYRG